MEGLPHSNSCAWWRAYPFSFPAASFLPPCHPFSPLSVDFPSLQEIQFWRTFWPPSLQLFNLYGTTECSCWATINRIAWKEEEGSLTPNILASIGTPLEGTEIEIQAASEADGDGEGELWIGGERRICLIGDEIAGPRLRPTGDLVKKEGNLVRIIGRKDNQVKLQGKRCQLDDLERRTLQLPGITFAKFCPPSPLSNDDMCCFVLLKPRSKPSPSNSFCFVFVLCVCVCYFCFCFFTLAVTFFFFFFFHSAAAIWVHMRQHIPAFALPGAIYDIGSSLPVTPNGKVDTVALLEHHRNHDILREVFLPSARLLTSLPDCLDAVISLTSKILALDPTTVHGSDLLLSLGGTSLEAARLAHLLLENHPTPKRALPSAREIMVPALLNSSLENCGRTLFDLLRESGNALVHSRPSVEPETPRQLGLKKLKVTPPQVSPTFHPAGVSIRRATSISWDYHPPAAANASLTVTWKVFTGKCIDASPLVVLPPLPLTPPDTPRDAVVIIGSHSGLVKCVSVSLGEEIWTSKLGGRVESSCALSACGNYVAVGCYDSRLYTLAFKTGEIVWTFEAGAEIKSSPCVSGTQGDVIFGCHDGCVYCVNILSKSLVWAAKTNAEIVFSSPARGLASDSVFVGTLGGELLSISTGQAGSESPHRSRWAVALGKPVFSSPAVWRCPTRETDVVCVGCVDGTLSCVTGEGSPLWKAGTERPIFSSPCGNSVHRMVVVGSHDEHLYCLSQETGEVRWRHSLGSPVYSSPFVVTIPNSSPEDVSSSSAGGLVVVASTKGLLCVVDLLTGTRLCSISLPGEVFSSPICLPTESACLISIGCRDNYLYCLRLAWE